MSPRSLRFVFPAVLALLTLFAPACSHSKEPSAASTLWIKLIPTSGLALNDLQQRVGFQVILPSYLPDEKGAYTAAAEESPPLFPYSGGYQWQASVTISPLPSAEDQLEVSIFEWERQAGDSRSELPYVEDSTKIGETTVTCHVDPSDPISATPPGKVETMPPNSFLWPDLDGVVNPSYICLWDTNRLHLYVSFEWLPSGSVPTSIAPDRRNEAMKVVTSMIEDPYVP